MLVGARGLAELLSNKTTQIVTVNGFLDFFRGSFLGISWLIWIFVIVAVVGWFLLNRTTFGRRTVAIGGNFEAARLAGIQVKRHLVALYVLVGLTAGIAAVMMLGRTIAGTSTHGLLYELDAIAAVVVGGTPRGRPRHDRRSSACHLLDADERVHAEQPVHGAGRREGRHHRGRRAAPAALRGAARRTLQLGARPARPRCSPAIRRGASSCARAEDAARRRQVGRRSARPGTDDRRRRVAHAGRRGDARADLAGSATMHEPTSWARCECTSRRRRIHREPDDAITALDVVSWAAPVTPGPGPCGTPLPRMGAAPQS